MRIVVEQDHIDRANEHRLPGEYPDATKCPVALALLDMGHYAHVCPDEGLIDWDGSFYSLPNSVIDWTINFDEEEPVYPFGFDLETELDDNGLRILAEWQAPGAKGPGN